METNDLSLCDGMSCMQIALDRLGARPDQYFASEIEKSPIWVTNNNYPGTKQIGDITRVRGIDLPKIRILGAGTPCQGLSYSGNRLNLEDPRSRLFFDFVRIKNEVGPEWWLLENVKMDKISEATISSILGVQPFRFNSNLVSAQNRGRLYWTNIPVNSIPDDRRIYLKDILEDNPIDPVVMSESTQKRFEGYGVPLVDASTPKARCLAAQEYIKNGKQGNYVRMANGRIRKLTVLECERLQTVPEGYCRGVSNSAAYHMLGNGWTIDIICHILKHIPNLQTQLN